MLIYSNREGNGEARERGSGEARKDKPAPTIFMDISVDIDIKKLEKALGADKNRLKYLFSRAAKSTAGNMRTKMSKDSLGLGELKRKKVPRARIKQLHKGVGVWVGLNPISAKEFRGRKQESDGGVSFRGRFFKDAFIGKFANDPKGTTRIMRRSGSQAVEVLIPIEQDAKKYIEAIIIPMVMPAFNKNFEKAVDALPHFWKNWK